MSTVTEVIDRAAWLEKRRHSIGASDAPVIAGLSKYKTRLSLWLEKTGQMASDEAGPEAWWGNELEPLIAKRASLDNGTVFTHHQIVGKHPDYPFITATLDAQDDDGFIHEFKSVGYYTGREIESDRPATLPLTWQIQAQQQMAVFDHKAVKFDVLRVDERKMYYVTVPRDNELIASTIALDCEFWAHVQNMTPPAEFDIGDDEVLMRHYKAVERQTIELTGADWEDTASQFAESRREEKRFAGLKSIAKAKILAAMASADLAKIGPFEFTRKLVPVKGNPNPKPKPASSYIRFTLSGDDDE